MEQKLANHILEKYKPLALLLHGSRASGNSRERSDWDFAIIVNNKINTDREIIDNQNIEIRVLVLPVPELTRENSSPWLVLRKGNVKVLFDPDNITEKIINQVTEYYNIPLVFTDSDINGHGAWFRSQVDGMIDYQNEQEAFFRKLSELYPRVIMYWFHFLEKAYMPQVYYSLPLIQKKDPEYFSLLETLAGNYSNLEKINAANLIYNKLFN